jgi:uncharacterized membrane protein
MGSYELLLFLHVVAACVWVGGAVLLAALAVGVLRGRDAEDVARFTATLRRIGPLVLAPAMVATAGFGIWMVLDSAAWGFDQGWVRLALGLFVAAFVVGAAHQSWAAINAERAAADGRAADALRFLRRWTYGYAAIVVLLLAALWDMTSKPGL